MDEVFTSLLVFCLIHSPVLALEPSVPLEEFRVKILKDVNEAREAHSAPPLYFNDSINELAQEWAEKLAGELRRLQHRGNNSCGECLYWATGDLSVAWYAEEQLYDYDNPVFDYSTGHFTQLVWKDSKELGVGVARAEDGIHWVVANFSPRGNIPGDFPINVLPPKKFLKEETSGASEDLVNTTAGFIAFASLLRV